MVEFVLLVWIPVSLVKIYKHIVQVALRDCFYIIIIAIADVLMDFIEIQHQIVVKLVYLLVNIVLI